MEHKISNPPLTRTDLAKIQTNWINLTCALLIGNYRFGTIRSKKYKVGLHKSRDFSTLLTAKKQDFRLQKPCRKEGGLQQTKCAIGVSDPVPCMVNTH